MPASAFTTYGAAIEAIARANLDLDGSTFVATLHGASYTPQADVDDEWSDVSASELVTGNGYTAGGVALTSVTVTRSGATVTFDAADVSWPNSTLTAKWVVVTRRAGASLAASDRLVGFCELETGGTVSTTNGTLSVQWNAAGLFTVSRQ
jgi:hypothetical protein